MASQAACQPPWQAAAPVGHLSGGVDRPGMAPRGQDHVPVPLCYNHSLPAPRSIHPYQVAFHSQYSCARPSRQGQSWLGCSNLGIISLLLPPAPTNSPVCYRTYHLENQHQATSSKQLLMAQWSTVTSHQCTPPKCQGHSTQPIITSVLHTYTGLVWLTAEMLHQTLVSTWTLRLPVV